MTIRQKLYISFFLILLIIVSIIGVFFYSIYNLNEIHMAQKHRYDQIRRVEKLKEYNDSFSWLVLDIITDFDKIKVVEDRMQKGEKLFKNLNLQKKDVIENSESSQERKNLEIIFLNLENIQKLIKNDLYTMVLKNQQSRFEEFNKEFDKYSSKTLKLILLEIEYLQDMLDVTQEDRNHFIDTIKIELVLLLVIAFLFSILISSIIIKDIKEKLYRLNKGVLQLFNDDENLIKVDIGENNELSEITNNLNSYLEKQSDIIRSREELLRNMSHELKTPITKGKFLLENLKQKNSDELIVGINSVFVDIEELTSKLLQREKLNFATLNLTTFKISSLVLQSLSKLSIDDESKIIVDIKDDFNINADKYYLTMALKNLIDNALKYAQEFPIEIQSEKNRIYIKNISKRLSNDFIYYIRPFTRDVNQQTGHGLGLNIVNKIVQMHGFKLEYKYENSQNIFYIVF